MRHALILFVVVMHALNAQADDVLNVIPATARFVPNGEQFKLPKTGIVAFADGADREIAEKIARAAGTATGGAWTVNAGTPDATIVFERPASSNEDGSYQIVSTAKQVRLVGATASGRFYATMTLMQLLDLWPNGNAGENAHEMPSGTLTDAPRFAHRGLLLDSGRHFIPVADLKRYIDLMAMHKLNILHWHLTEDQGWRIEIRRYPELTRIGAWRKATRDSEQPRDAEGRYGGFYTQAEICDLVAYAQGRHIRIVPEIELPGHCVAALAVHPELSCTGGPFEVGTAWGVYDDIYCAGNDKTFEFLENVLTEVLELFPSEEIHIGGDEAPKARWKACPKCQARIKAEGLANESALQSYFVRRVGAFLKSKNRRLVGWDEILEGGLGEDAVVQSWRGFKGAIEAAKSGHDVIASPTSHCYIDYAQGNGFGEPRFMGFLPLEKVYEFEPVPPELSATEARHIIGGEAALWTEHASPALLDRQAFPRLCAIAEALWSPREKRDWQGFERRWHSHRSRLDALGVSYYVAPPELRAPETTFIDTLDVQFLNPGKFGEIRYSTDDTDPVKGRPAPERSLRLSESAKIRAVVVLPNGNTGPEARAEYRKLTWHPGVQTLRSAPGVTWACYEGDWQRLPEFSKLTPAKEGISRTIDLSVRTRPEKFAFRFGGFVDVPRDAAYTIHVRSDDGARLQIHDELVVDNDGLHAASEKSGRILLRAGRHPFSLEYFDAGSASVLVVEIESAEASRQAIPAEWLTN